MRSFFFSVAWAWAWGGGRGEGGRPDSFLADAVRPSLLSLTCTLYSVRVHKRGKGSDDSGVSCFSSNFPEMIFFHAFFLCSSRACGCPWRYAYFARWPPSPAWSGCWTSTNGRTHTSSSWSARPAARTSLTLSPSAGGCTSSWPSASSSRWCRPSWPPMRGASSTGTSRTKTSWYVDLLILIKTSILDRNGCFHVFLFKVNLGNPEYPEIQLIDFGSGAHIAAGGGGGCGGGAVYTDFDGESCWPHRRKKNGRPSSPPISEVDTQDLWQTPFPLSF